MTLNNILAPIDSTLHPEPYYQQYCSHVEPYALGHILLQFLHQGWQPENTVIAVRYPLPSGLYSTIYHFKLRLDDLSLRVPILGNPAVIQVLERYRLTVTERQSR